MKKSILWSLALFAAAALNLTSARADAPMRSDGGPVTMFIKGTAGPGPSDITAATPLSTPLWDVRFSKPVTAPDGHQLTLGEWVTAQPRAAIKCNNQGTHITIHISGLIPHGVYSTWVLIFDGPFGVATPGKPAPFGHLVGVGSLGANDGSENTFQASASGEGQFNVTMAPQALSSAGPPFVNNHYLLEGCLLDEVEVHLSGIYHFDGQSHGPDPGFPFGAAEAFKVVFQP